nr:hypothetical protein [Tanacetum cinerariifolium]
MQETYENDEATPIPTPIISVHNWALKNNLPVGPPFTSHMLEIYEANGLVSFKAPKATSQTRKLELEGKNPKAKT